MPGPHVCPHSQEPRGPAHPPCNPPFQHPSPPVPYPSPLPGPTRPRPHLPPNRGVPLFPGGRGPAGGRGWASGPRGPQESLGDRASQGREGGGVLGTGPRPGAIRGACVYGPLWGVHTYGSSCFLDCSEVRQAGSWYPLSDSLSYLHPVLWQPRAPTLALKWGLGNPRPVGCSLKRGSRGQGPGGVSGSSAGLALEEQPSGVQRGQAGTDAGRSLYQTRRPPCRRPSSLEPSRRQSSRKAPASRCLSPSAEPTEATGATSDSQRHPTASCKPGASPGFAAASEDQDSGRWRVPRIGRAHRTPLGPPFKEEETEAGRGRVTGPRPHRGLRARQPGPGAPAVTKQHDTRDYRDAAVRRPEQSRGCQAG